MSNTYHNSHTLSQSTSSLFHVTSTHITLSRTHLPMLTIHLFVTHLPHGGREGGTDNGMEETKVGESEGERGK